MAEATEAVAETAETFDSVALDAFKGLVDNVSQAKDFVLGASTRYSQSVYWLVYRRKYF